MARTNYRVNLAARSLRTDRSGLVGFLIPGFRNDQFGLIAEHVDEGLREHDMSLIIGSSGWSEEGDLRVLDSFEARGLDALILAPTVDRSAQFAAAVKALRTPVVLVDRELPRTAVDAVLIDMRGGIQAALAHLVSLGHRRIGLAAYRDDIRPGREARLGFQYAVAELGLDPDPRLIVTMDSLRPETGQLTARSLMALGPTACIVGGPTGVLVACLRELRSHVESTGGSIPRDLSVVAIGDEIVRQLQVPELTTVTRSARDEGHAIADMVVRRLANPRARTRIELRPMTLEIGRSTAPAHGA